MRISCPQCGAERVAAVKMEGRRNVVLVEHHVPEEDAVKTSCRSDLGVELLIDVLPPCSWSNAIVRFP